MAYEVLPTETVWATVEGGALAEFVLWEDVEGEIFATVRVANRRVFQRNCGARNASAEAEARDALNEVWRNRRAVRFDMAKARKEAAARRKAMRSY